MPRLVLPWLTDAVPWKVAVLSPGSMSQARLPIAGVTVASVVTTKQSLCGLLQVDPQVNVLVPVGVVSVEFTYFTVKSKLAFRLLPVSVGKTSLGLVLDVEPFGTTLPCPAA